jgi:hypothetical protein
MRLHSMALVLLARPNMAVVSATKSAPSTSELVGKEGVDNAVRGAGNASRNIKTYWTF